MRVRENISLGNCIPESNLKSPTFIIAYVRYNVIGISFRIAETIPAKYSKYFVFSGGFFYLKQKFLPLDLCRLLMDKRRDRRMKFLHDSNISFNFSDFCHKNDIILYDARSLRFIAKHPPFWLIARAGRSIRVDPDCFEKFYLGLAVQDRVKFETNFDLGDLLDKGCGSTADSESLSSGSDSG